MCANVHVCVYCNDEEVHIYIYTHTYVSAKLSKSGNSTLFHCLLVLYVCRHFVVVYVAQKFHVWLVQLRVLNMEEEENMKKLPP